MGVVYEAFDRERHERVALKTLLHSTPPASTVQAGVSDARGRPAPEPRAPLRARRRSRATRCSSRWSSSRGTDFLESRAEGRNATARQRADRASLTVDTVEPQGAQDARGASARPSVEPEPGPRTPFAGRLRAAAPRAAPARRGRARAARRGQAAPRHQAVERAGHRRGRVVLLDFGVATELDARAHEAAARRRGRRHRTYMAPEQASGEAPAPRRTGTASARALRGARRAAAVRRLGDRRAHAEEHGGPDRAVGVRARGARRTSTRSACALLAPDPENRPDAAGDPAPPRRRDARATRPPRLPCTDGARGDAPRRPRAATRALRDAFEATRAGSAVTVRVSGPSGMGKSTLVQHFLDELERAQRGLVLRGRAYERESVPTRPSTASSTRSAAT